jgi:hypothetical protein
VHSRSSDYALREVTLDASVIARASIIASVVSTSSYSQSSIKALPKHLQRDAYLKALYPLARLIRPAIAMKWCVEAAASMTDDELHALITSPKELKKCFRSYEQLAARKNGVDAERREGGQEADADSAETDSETSDYNDNSSSGSGSGNSDGSSDESVAEDEGSTSASDGDDDDGDDGSGSGTRDDNSDEDGDDSRNDSDDNGDSEAASSDD